MKYARIQTLRALAHHKKPGYLPACRAAGKVCRDGKWLQFTDEAHAQIALQYATPLSPPCTKPGGRIPSLANAVDRTAPKNCLPCQAKPAAFSPHATLLHPR
jgi:hypothetical protein